MKILIISHEFPPVGGGAATACGYIVEYLTKVNEQIDVITSAFNELPKQEELENCIIRRIFCCRKQIHTGRLLEYLLFIIKGMPFLAKEIARIKPDIVYAFLTLPSGALALFLKKIYKIPYFVFLRGIDVPGSRGKFDFLNKIFAPFIVYIWANSDIIIANSQSLKELASQTLRRKPIVVIPNGVDLNLFFPPAKPRLNKKIKILSVGRISKEKGLIYLLESVAIIAKGSHSPFILEIVGDGTEKDDLIKAVLKLNITDKIIFQGWKDRENLLKKYQDSDIFVTPSLYEAMPNTVLEAMACALPIIASDIPAHKELIIDNQNGLLVPAKDSRALADAIKSLMQDMPLRLKIGEKNVEKMKEYNYQNIFAKLYSLNLKWKTN